MAIVHFTAHLDGVAPPEPMTVDGETVAQALDQIWAQNKRLKGYVLDDQGRVRKHIAVFIDGQLVRDKAVLDHPVSAETEIHVLQALSGG